MLIIDEEVAVVPIDPRDTSRGAIIVRQHGTKFHPGENVGLGRDYTLFATAAGFIKFEHMTRDKKRVSVYPERQVEVHEA